MTSTGRKVMKTSKKCFSNSTEVQAYAHRFPKGYWFFLGPGSEEKWYGMHSYKPEGQWNRSAEMMMLTLRGNGNPAFRATSAMDRGLLKSKKGGKLSIHYNGDLSHAELVDMPVLQILEEPVVHQHQEETVKVIKLFPAGRNSECIIQEFIPWSAHTGLSQRAFLKGETPATVRPHTTDSSLPRPLCASRQDPEPLALFLLDHNFIETSDRLCHSRSLGLLCGALLALLYSA